LYRSHTPNPLIPDQRANRVPSPGNVIRRARTVLRHILIGRDETPKDAEPKTKQEADERPARRIHDFLFRGVDRAGSVPSFFERDRLHFGEPCSVTELRDELSHLTRRFERARELKQEKQALVVWTSGGLNYFGDEMVSTVGAATAEAQKAGLDVFFVYASDASSGDAGANLPAFESKFGIQTQKYDLAAPLYSGDVEVAIAGKFRECLHPSLRHLYLSIPNDDGGSDDVLYFVRAPFEHNEPRRLPLAIRANDRELAAFQECWNRLRDHTPEPASQMPKKVPKKG
jgi:hypothetical protein